MATSQHGDVGATNSQRIIIAVDIGTTSVKVVAVDADVLLGKAVGSASLARTEESYPLDEPLPGRFEQQPKRIAEAAEKAVAEAVKQCEAIAAQVIAVTFSSAMHSLIGVDEQGEPLTACITWADLRAAGHAAALRKQGIADSIARRTGVPVHAMTPLCKLMWMREQEPKQFDAIHYFVGIKDYLLHRWCGSPFVMDESVAGGTGLYNLAERRWDQELLTLAGIDESRLPQLVPATYKLKLKPETAAALKLPSDVPVVAGAADGPLANLGAGAIEEGVAAVTVGTSGAIRIGSDQPDVDEGGRLFCYPLADQLWISGGAVNNGGIVFRWLRDKLVPADAADAVAEGQDPYERLIELAFQVQPGAEGLLFMPHLAGERAPHWDENARGVFFGLSLSHDRRHMLRAGLEGIVFGLRSVAEAVNAASGVPLREVRASGGFARSSVLRQLMADILGCPVTQSDTQEASAIGAAMLALRALGEARSLNELAAAVRTVDRCEPRTEAVEVYNRLYPVYSSLYASLAPAFENIAAYQRS